MSNFPTTEDDARSYARTYVQKILSRGYSQEIADREILSGYGSPDDAEIFISYGKVSVTNHRMDSRPKWIFKFSELAVVGKRLRQGQFQF